MTDSVYTPENIKQAINLVCKWRKPDTKMVYTRAFRAFALQEACHQVRGNHDTRALKNFLEDTFAQYEVSLRGEEGEVTQPAVPMILGIHPTKAA